MTTSLRYAARSSVGLVRSSNQDSGYAGPHLMVLCDGMGGPAGGDIASAVAVDHLVPLDADSHQAGDLLGLLRDQFNLRMQKATGQLGQSHLLSQVKRDIARVKTVLNQQAGK